MLDNPINKGAFSSSIDLRQNPMFKYVFTDSLAV